MGSRFTEVRFVIMSISRPSTGLREGAPATDRPECWNTRDSSRPNYKFNAWKRARAPA